MCSIKLSLNVAITNLPLDRFDEYDDPVPHVLPPPPPKLDTLLDGFTPLSPPPVWHFFFVNIEICTQIHKIER